MSSMMSYKGHRGCGNLLLLLVSEPEFVYLARSIVYKPYRNRESGRRVPYSIALYTYTENPTACPFYVVRIRCSELQCHSAPIFFLLGLLLGRHS